jgi:hypothetical protein
MHFAFSIEQLSLSGCRLKATFIDFCLVKHGSVLGNFSAATAFAAGSSSCYNHNYTVNSDFNDQKKANSIMNDQMRDADANADDHWPHNQKHNRIELLFIFSEFLFKHVPYILFFEFFIILLFSFTFFLKYFKA